jgi:dTDP-4-dehydrorhamnose reductase
MLLCKEADLKILILGGSGQVGTELKVSLACQGEILAPGRASLDLRAGSALEGYLQAHRPEVIVNAAAYTAVDQAESQAEPAMCLNAQLPARLAAWARAAGALLIHFSSDYVYDGTKTSPYREDDRPAPLNQYGRSKLAGDEAIINSGADYVILRTSWVYSRRGRNFVRTVLRLAQTRSEMRVVADQIGAPTRASLLAGAVSLVLERRGRIADLSGVYHLCPQGALSWWELAGYIVERARSLGGVFKLEAGRIASCPSHEYPTPALRPANSRLDCAKIERVFALSRPDWKYHLDLLLQELAQAGFQE